MAKVLVLRYNKGKLPPSAVTDEVKQQLGGAMEKYLKERKADGKPIIEIKQVSLCISKKIAEITPDTSNILNYEKIMKN